MHAINCLIILQKQVLRVINFQPCDSQNKAPKNSPPFIQSVF